MVAGACRTCILVALLATIYVANGVVRGADEKVEISFSATFPTVGGKQLRADIYRPPGPGPYPGVLCVHGGAWIAGHRLSMIRIAHSLAQHGYAAVAIEYRLAPLDRFPAQLEDCQAGLAWMRQEAAKHKIDPTRIGAWGYSAGAHLVTLLALRESPKRPGLKAADDPARIRAVVAGGAPSDFRQLGQDDVLLAFWLGGTRRQLPAVYEAASPAVFVSPDDPPVFYYHGETDMLVAIAQTRAMAELLKGAGVPVSFYPRPGSGHVQAFLDGTTVTKGIEFLDRHLKALAPADPREPLGLLPDRTLSR